MSIEAPKWAFHTGPGGELSREQALQLAPVAAARLAPHALAIFAVDARPGSVHELPRLVSQEVFLADLPDARVVLAIESADLSRFTADSAHPSESGELDFADRVAVLARPLEPFGRPVVAARQVVALDASRPAATVSLPEGNYRVRALDCTFGWWVEDLQGDVPGPALRVVLHPARIARTAFPLDGAPRSIARVVLVHELHDGLTRSSGELEVPWMRSQNEIQVALAPRTGTYWQRARCALRVYWRSGEVQTTSFGPWTGLEGFLSLQD